MKYTKDHDRTAIWRPALLLVALIALLAPLAQADDEYAEALKQTEEEWGAVRQTVQQSKSKFDEFRNKYQEYEDKVFSQDMEKGIEFARQLFKLDKSQTDLAKEKLSQLREMFNTLDKNGLKSKLKSASEMLDKADGMMGEVDNAWEFAKKFDPANAKDNPTYGLRLIGDLLTEGADKMGKIPLVGQILGPWLKAYGEVAGDFANALDRLGKKIEEFRGGSLCGQLGYKTDQQKAFEALAGGGDCLTYFAYGGFPRLRGEAYEGNDYYFLFDPNTKRGYLSHPGNTDKVYAWHNLLLEMQALDPDWLASRANSLTADVESRARKYYQWFSGWKNYTDRGYMIIEKLGLKDQAWFYGRLDEETFVANYVISEKHHDAIEKIVQEYEKYCIIGGTVYERVGSDESPSSGAVVEFTINGKSFSESTNDNGDYEILVEGKEGDRLSAKVSKQDFETINETGGIPRRVTTGNVYTLTRESMEITVSGTVYIKASDTSTAQPADGATVSAGATEATELGSATTGGDGTYSLTVRAQEGVKLTLSATKDEATGSATTTVASEAVSGVDITMTKAPEVPDTAKWTINVTVKDSDGKGVATATVSGGPGGGVSTGADGTATVGPIPVTSDPFSVTLSASVVAEDGSTISGASQTVTYNGESPTNVVLSIEAQQAEEVTIFGRVTDVNNIGIDGAAVTAGTMSATSGGGGSFSLGPVMMTQGQSVEVSASYNDGTNSHAATPQTVTFDGTSKNLSVVLVISTLESFQEVTISGSVIDRDGQPLPGATVTGPTGSGSAVSDAGGRYTLGAVEIKLGEAVTVSATMTIDTQTVSGQATVTPTGPTATAPAITLADIVQVEVLTVTVSGSVVDKDGNGVGGATVTAKSASTSTDGSGGYTLSGLECEKDASLAISATGTDGEGNSMSGRVTITPASETEFAPAIVLKSDTGDDLDSLIDSLDRETEGQDPAALLAEFNAIVSELDGIASDFYATIDYFDQRLRELGDSACKASDVSYALNQAKSQFDLYGGVLAGLYGTYADLTVASDDNPGVVDMGSADAAFDRVVDRETAMSGRLQSSRAQYAAYKCDEESAETETGDKADEDADPDDVETGADDGGGVEVCDDGIDNDGDNEIDECDAGCCDKNVQITVTDCGPAADDIFLIAVDGGDVGVTPKGAANTFNVELSPGSHTVKVTCLDDGGEPGVSDDIGTVCISIVVYDNNAGIGGGEVRLDLGEQHTESFVVPEGPATTTVIQNFNGSTLQHLENR